MIVARGNAWTRVVSAEDTELTWLDDYLSFVDDKARWSPAFKSGRWDGRTRMYNRVARAFPSGLFGMARRGAERVGYRVEEVDQRVADEPTGPDPAWLRDYQREALADCLREKRGVVQQPTGSGKTELFCGLGLLVPCSWLVLVHKADLLRQTAERFERRTGERAGVVGDGEWRPARWTVATFQTLVRRKRDAAALLASVGGVVVDECHSVGADTWYPVVMAAVNAGWRLGFSATPLARGDRRNVLLIAATGGLIHRTDPGRLIEAGVLSRPTIRLVPVVQNTLGFDWRSVYEKGVVKSAPRNAALVAVLVAAAKPALAFVKEIGHGREVLRGARAAGLRADFAWGADDTAARLRAIERLRRGDLDVLVSSPIFEEGVDIPEVASVVIGSGGKSVIKALQRLGRGMRVTAAKTTVGLWDVDDRGNPILASHSRARRAAYMQQGYEVVEAEVPIAGKTDLLGQRVG